MKFAFFIFKYFPYGGVQRDMLRIAEDCAQLGHEVIIYTGEWRGDKPVGNIRVEVLASKGFFNHQRHRSLIREMLAVIRKELVDIVIGFNRMPNLDVYFAADPCFLANAYEKKGFLYRLTGRFRFFRDCEAAVFDDKGASQILCLNKRDMEIFEYWYKTPSNRFNLIPPNIPKDKFFGKSKEKSRKYLRSQFNLPEDAKVILTVGSAYLRKGVDRAVKAFATLPNQLKNNTWLISIGEHESRSGFAHDVKKLGILNRCILAGGRSDVSDLMLGADLLLHPARSELAGLVIIEAMTAGLPVLVTDVCGYAAHVKEADAGVVIDSPFKQTKLNHALLNLLESSTEQYSSNGIRYTNKLSQSNPKNFEANFLINQAIIKKSRKLSNL